MKKLCARKGHTNGGINKRSDLHMEDILNVRRDTHGAANTRNEQ